MSAIHLLETMLRHAGQPVTPTEIARESRDALNDTERHVYVAMRALLSQHDAATIDTIVIQLELDANAIKDVCGPCPNERYTELRGLWQACFLEAWRQQR